MVKQYTNRFIHRCYIFFFTDILMSLRALHQCFQLLYLSVSSISSGPEIDALSFVMFSISFLLFLDCLPPSLPRSASISVLFFSSFYYLFHFFQSRNRRCISCNAFLPFSFSQIFFHQVFLALPLFLFLSSPVPSMFL